VSRRTTQCLLVIASLCASVCDADCAASLGGGGRWYVDRVEHTSSYDRGANASGAVECTILQYAGQVWTLDVFARAAQHDSARTYADIRELAWTYTRDSLQLRAGIDQVFWGVTEFAHVVDIVNQADVLEDPFGETKLGQPLISASMRQSWGNFTALAMPRFRDRVFPDLGDPLRPVPTFTLGPAQFESGAGRNHLDWALRYAYTKGPFDIGLSYFNGTGRDPLFDVTIIGGQPQFYSLYPQIAQAGLDAQVTLGDWALKFEAARRRTYGREQSAWTVGVERLLSGLAGSGSDLTIVFEYSRDQRTPVGVPGFLQDDWAVGLRLAMNDVRTTEGKFGVIIDSDHGSRAWAIELSTRVAQQWRLAAEARLFGNVSVSDPLRAMSKDGYLDVSLTRYF
jgi:hypothetical protein